MDAFSEQLNGFLVNTFNNILRWESSVLNSSFDGRFSVSEFHVIEAVIEAQSAEQNTMSEVAARLGVTVGTLTTSVKTLCAKGALLRQKGDADRRTVWLSPTPLAEEANRFHKEFHRRMVGGVTDCLEHSQLLVLTEALAVLGDWFAQLEREASYIQIPSDDD